MRIQDGTHIAQAMAGDGGNLRFAAADESEASDSGAAQIVESQFGDSSRDAREPPRRAEPVLCRAGLLCSLE